MNIIINKQEREFLLRSLSKTNFKNDRDIDSARKLKFKLENSTLISLNKVDYYIINTFVKFSLKALTEVLDVYKERKADDYYKKAKDKLEMVEKLDKKLSLKQGEK